VLKGWLRYHFLTLFTNRFGRLIAFWKSDRCMCLVTGVFKNCVRNQAKRVRKLYQASASAWVFNRKFLQWPTCCFKRPLELSIRPGKALPTRPLSLENHNMSTFRFSLSQRRKQHKHSSEIKNYIKKPRLEFIWLST